MFIGIFYLQAARADAAEDVISKSRHFPCSVCIVYLRKRIGWVEGIEESNNIIFRHLINISLMKKSYKTSYLTSQTQNLVKH